MDIVFDTAAPPAPPVEDEPWEGASSYELLFWFLVIVGHLVFIFYTFWRLAVKYTESSGTPVYIIVKEDAKEEVLPTSVEKATGSSLLSRRRNVDGNVGEE